MFSSFRFYAWQFALLPLRLRCPDFDYCFKLPCIYLRIARIPSTDLTDGTVKGFLMTLGFVLWHILLMYKFLDIAIELFCLTPCAFAMNLFKQ